VDPYEAVGGFFRVSVDDHYSRAIEAEITGSALANYLTQDLPELGALEVGNDWGYVSELDSGLEL
jgi:hypothetical protein